MADKAQHCAVVIQAKQDELLVSKLEEAIKILKKDKFVQKRVCISKSPLQGMLLVYKPEGEGL